MYYKGFMVYFNFMLDKSKKGMIFGVFDGLHDGHRFFINSARKYSKKLVIVVTPDEIILKIKGRRPTLPLFQRMQTLMQEYKNAEIIVGDKKLHSWQVIKENKPDVIIVGYDQREMKKALEKIAETSDFKIITIDKDLVGDKLHSSLLSKK